MDDVVYKGFKEETIMECTLGEDGYWTALLTERQHISEDLKEWITKEAVLKVMEKTSQKAVQRAHELLVLRLKRCGGNLFAET